MKKALRFVAVAVLGLSMTSGVASATSGMGGSGSIDTTGPNSYNEVRTDIDRDVRVRNRNQVSVDNTTDQFAQSGTAVVSTNTTAGDAWTGDATNDNWTGAQVRVNNSPSSQAALDCGCESMASGMGGGSIETTGPNSENIIDFDYDSDVRVTNRNNVQLNNDTVQTAVTGDATVTNNTTAGSAVTGDATNVNTTDFMVEITN